MVSVTLVMPNKTEMLYQVYNCSHYLECTSFHRSLYAPCEFGITTSATLDVKKKWTQTYKAEPYYRNNANPPPADELPVINDYVVLFKSSQSDLQGSKYTVTFLTVAFSLGYLIGSVDNFRVIFYCKKIWRVGGRTVLELYF